LTPFTDSDDGRTTTYRHRHRPDRGDHFDRRDSNLSDVGCTAADRRSHCCTAERAIQDGLDSDCSHIHHGLAQDGRSRRFESRRHIRYSQVLDHEPMDRVQMMALHIE
jgi:hypothetical protein